MKVSAVITTYNRKNDVLRCVESVLASDFADLETIVVDNASQDGTAQALRERFGSAITVGDKERDIEAGRAAGVGTNILFAGTFPDIDVIVSLTNADLKKYNIEKQFNRRVQS